MPHTFAPTAATDDDPLTRPHSPADPPTAAELAPAQRRALRSRAHALKPVVMVGSAGITDTLVAELDGALQHHELVKVRFLGSGRHDIDDAARELCQRLGATPIQRIGHVAVIYRQRPPQPDPGTDKPSRRWR